MSSERFVIESGGRTRDYVVVVPRVGGSDPLSVVVFLHGAGGTAEWSLEETRLGETAAREGFLLVLPEGTRVDPAAPPGFLQNPQVWNDGADRGPVVRSTADDVAFLTALLDDVQRRHPVAADRIYLSGFSNGAGMAFRYAAEAGHRLAAVAPVAGHFVGDQSRLPVSVPTLYLVGDSDPLIPLSGGEVISPWNGYVQRRPGVHQSLDCWAAANACRLPAARTEVETGIHAWHYHGDTDDAEVLGLVIAGLGHHWPGGRGQLRRRLAGPPSSRLDANTRIWQFFRDRRRVRR